MPGGTDQFQICQGAYNTSVFRCYTLYRVSSSGGGGGSFPPRTNSLASSPKGRVGKERKEKKKARREIREKEGGKEGERQRYWFLLLHTYSRCHQEYNYYDT